MPEEIDYLEGLDELDVDALKELVAGQRESVAIAEEGAAAVDAYAERHDGRVSAAQTILQAAHAALAAFSVDQIETVATQLENGENIRRSPVVDALRKVKGATQDVEISQNDARLAKQAAVNHRVVTVDSAKARLAAYEAYLKSRS